MSCSSKKIVALFFSLNIFFISFNSLAQTVLMGIIRDSLTQKPIAYCNISDKEKTFSSISNEDGQFKIKNVSKSNILVFNSIGYKTMEVATQNTSSNLIVNLNSALKEDKLKEMPKPEFLCDIIEKCKENISVSDNQTSKVYYKSSTEISDQPIELMECYYNSTFNDAAVKDLNYKNGRLGCAFFKNQLISNQNIAAILRVMNLTSKNDLIPYNPLQLSKKEILNHYSITLKDSTTSTNYYAIKFIPKKELKLYFEGEIWINKRTFQLDHIILNVKKTMVHPFKGHFLFWLRPVSYSITKNYSSYTNQLNYISLDLETSINMPNDTNDYILKTKSLWQYYDFDNLFIEPQFSYLPYRHTYSFIISQPYNSFFWNSNIPLPYSEKSRKIFNYLKSKGALIGFADTIKSNNQTLNELFKNFFILWDPIKRITIERDIKNNERLNTMYLNNVSHYSKYGISNGLYLDINKDGEGYNVLTKSVFNTYGTTYAYQNNPYASCFINLFFDFYEIEKQKLEKILANKRLSPLEIKVAYQRAYEEADRITNVLMLDTKSGKLSIGLKKWNDMVLKELQIDNMAIFGVTEKFKPK